MLFAGMDIDVASFQIGNFEHGEFEGTLGSLLIRVDKWAQLDVASMTCLRIVHPTLPYSTDTVGGPDIELSRPAIRNHINSCYAR